MEGHTVGLQQYIERFIEMVCHSVSLAKKSKSTDAKYLRSFISRTVCNLFKEVPIV